MTACDYCELAGKCIDEKTDRIKHVGSPLCACEYDSAIEYKKVLDEIFLL